MQPPARPARRPGWASRIMTSAPARAEKMTQGQTWLAQALLRRRPRLYTINIGKSMPSRADFSLPQRPRAFPLRLDFVGLGAPKCGTTWLARRLQAHPQVVMTGERPLITPFFHLSPDAHLRGWGELKKGVDDTARQVFFGNYFNEYLYSGYALRYLAANFPHVKLYVALRNPLTRAVSHYLHHLVWTQVIPPERGFLEAAADPALGILDQGHYQVYLRRWLDYFPPQQIMLLLFEDLRQFPLNLLGQVAAFLGLSQPFALDLPPERGRNRNLVSQVDLSQETIAQVHEAYAETRAFCGAWLGRDLDQVWKPQVSRAQPGAKVTEQEVKLAKALLHLDNREEDQAYALLRQLQKAGCRHPLLFEKLADLLELAGREEQARQMREAGVQAGRPGEACP